MAIDDPEAKREFKDELYEAFARVGKALAGPKRLEMLDLLAQKERSVQELADAMSISVTNASQHLQTLQDARLVERRAEGNYRFYQLAGEDVVDLWRALRDLARRRVPDVDAVVEAYLGARESAEPPSPDELARLTETSVLLDVRPAGEYEQAHLEGAVSIPIDEIEQRADELPEDAEILVYCRGPFCTYSDQAVDVLREAGLEARRLEPGLPDFERMGAPVETGEEGSA
jgi:DNA-binding transcriptional ArsR family regulator